jgi:hypothetical protein
MLPIIALATLVFSSQLEVRTLLDGKPVAQADEVTRDACEKDKTDNLAKCLSDENSEFFSCQTTCDSFSDKINEFNECKNIRVDTEHDKRDKCFAENIANKCDNID